MRNAGFLFPPRTLQPSRGLVLVGSFFEAYFLKLFLTLFFDAFEDSFNSTLQDY